MDKRKRARIVSRTITAVVVLLVLTVIALGFVPKPVPVAVAKVMRRTLEVTVDEPGKTRLRARHVISAPVTGQLARVTLRAGDRVEQGAVLAEITPAASQLLDSRTRKQTDARVDVARANVARAKATTRRAESALAFARDQAERSRKLQQQGGASQQALEQAEYQARAAEEELATAQVGERIAENELAAARAALAEGGENGENAGDKVLVRAPLAGQVLRVLRDSEGVIGSGAPLLELGDVRAIEVVVDVLSADAVAISEGARAHIERWGGEGALNARVRRKEPSAFTTRSALGVEEQRVPVVLDLVDPPERWRGLGDGYRVETRILTARIDNATVVPSAALFREDGGFSAFRVRAGEAHVTGVETGARTPDWVEVKRGLADGDTVVIYPSDQVTDGVKVAPDGAERRGAGAR